MTDAERELRLMFGEASLEFDQFEIRVYPRPGQSSESARYIIDSPLFAEKRTSLAGHDNVVLYPGVMPDLERDEKDDLAQEALVNPAVQMLMTAFGGVLTSVKKAKP